MAAFVAEPVGARRGSVVMLQEIFGVNEAMREKARDFASNGYKVVVPDLFWRIQPRVDLGYSEAERAEGFGLMQKFDQAAGAADVRDAIAWLRDDDPDHRKVALIGFCLGGRLAVLAGAANPDVAAIVSFYGVRLDLCGDQLRALSGPFQLHVGDRDAHVPDEHVAAVRAALGGTPGRNIFVYADAQHGFYNAVRGDVYCADAAALARARTLALLANVQS